ncbi:hypothetical protein JMJ35_005835 [Cladonia borealis]|uniref:Uncharacterized protein n=1 Tax=Cladonia borealis TaxID=184061 RepID=A0AA39QXW8_9LECA|nr:hypothetical protein JMJ35_005835 [Cladonia borealis]
MSSPPTPTTSTRNVILSNPKGRRNSSAFASIAVLNPFRKKSIPDSSIPAPVKPYEVAPGIWNTDATAKAFGYIDTDDDHKRSKSKNQSVRRTKSNGRDRSEVPKRKPVPISARTTQFQVAYTHNSSGDSNNRTSANNEGDQGRAGREQKDYARESGRKSERRNRRSRMRTVDSDDRLTVRGANPRTGLVSPAIFSDNSDSSPVEDYINIRKPPISRNRSGKWKAEGQGWSLVESPRLSPIPQSTPGQQSRQASMKNLQDKLLLEIPGVDSPEPEDMTEQRTREYQEKVARIHKKEGSGAMVDPDTLPSPRAWTPEGPSTPPNRLQKLLRRKPVANEMRPRDDSADTVIRDEQKRASSVPTPRQARERHHNRVRIVTPSNTPRDSSLETHTEKKATTSPENPFLGLQQPISSQTANATQSQYTRLAQREEVQGLAPPNMQQQSHSRLFPQTKPQEGVHLRTHRENQSPSNEDLDPPATLTLSQYLPRLQFMHPSHFANLEKPPSCRPAQTLPARLRPLDQQRKVVEDACISTSTFTTTLSGSPARERRPRMQRHGGSRGVPKASHHPPEAGELEESCPLAGSPMSKQPSCTRLTEETQDPRHGKPCHIGLAHQVMPQRDEAEVIHPIGVPLDSADYQTKVASQGAEHAARLAVLGEIHNRPLQGPQPRKRSTPTSECGRLRLGSANVMREHAQKRSYGDGCTPTYGRRGENGNEISAEWGFVANAEDDVGSRAVHPIDPTEYAVRSDGSAWFAGHWAESAQAEGHLGSVVGKDVKALERRQPISKSAARAKLFLRAFEDWLQLSVKLSWVQHRLYKMARHVLRTFHHNSPALTVLRSPNAKPQDYLVAMKDISLAVAYLLVLLNVYMALRKLFMMAMRVVYWVCHPVDLVAVAFEWCVMT